MGWYAASTCLVWDQDWCTLWLVVNANVLRPPVASPADAPAPYRSCSVKAGDKSTPSPPPSSHPRPPPHWADHFSARLVARPRTRDVSRVERPSEDPRLKPPRATRRALASRASTSAPASATKATRARSATGRMTGAAACVCVAQRSGSRLRESWECRPHCAASSPKSAMTRPNQCVC